MLEDKVLHALLVLIIVANFGFLSLSRLKTITRLLGMQGVLLAGIVVVHHWPTVSAGTIMLATSLFLIAGILAPTVLGWVSRRSASPEDRPYVGYSASALLGLIYTSLAFWASSKVPFDSAAAAERYLPFALATVATGIFLIITRRKALSQVLGYLVLSNGVFLFSIALAAEQPVLLEIGILLDAVLASFVMSIGVVRIDEVFESIDVSKLSSLRDDL